MAFVFRQATVVKVSGTTTVNYGVAPLGGSLLVAFTSSRDVGTSVSVPAGWTNVIDSVGILGSNPRFGHQLCSWRNCPAGGLPVGVDFSGGGASYEVAIGEWTGGPAALFSVAERQTPDGPATETNPPIPILSPPAGSVAAMIGIMIMTNYPPKAWPAGWSTRGEQLAGDVYSTLGDLLVAPAAPPYNGNMSTPGIYDMITAGVWLPASNRAFVGEPGGALW